MKRHAINCTPIPPIPIKRSTALILVHNQLGYRHPTAWGIGGASNPAFEDNIAALLSAFRETSKSKPLQDRPTILHIQHRSVWTDSPLNTSHVGPYGIDGESKRGVDFLECATPLIGGKPVRTFDEPTQAQAQAQAQASDLACVKDTEQNEYHAETLMTSHEHSIFINTPLLKILEERGITTVVFAGLTLERSISTAVRTAQNLAVVGKWGGHGNRVDTPTSALYTDGEHVYADYEEGQERDPDDMETPFAVKMPRIILVTDGTRAFGIEGVDAETVHKVHMASLGEFAEMRVTEEVVTALGGGGAE